MPVITTNFTTIAGTTNIVQLLGSPTSISLTNRGTNPREAGKLGWLSLRLTSFNGVEQFGVTNWYAGTARVTAQLNTGLYAVFVTKRAGLLLTFTYVYP